MMIHTRRLSLKTKPIGVLGSLDKWQLDGKPLGPKDDSRISTASAFTRHVMKGDHQAAWRRIEKSIDQDQNSMVYFNTHSCSLFIQKSLEAPIDPETHWLKILKFATAMKRAGLRLSCEDYAKLFELALRGRDYPSVEALMREIEVNRPDLLHRVEIWNAYIQASCQAFPLFWPEKKADTVEWETPLPQIMNKMDIAGAVSNSKTYELIALAFARQGRMDLVQDVVKHAWFLENHPKESLMHPSLTTLMAIIEAYAFNGKLSQGISCSIVLQKRYQLPPLGAHAWARVLELAMSDVDLLEQVWERATFKQKPSIQMWGYRTQAYRKQGKYDLLASSVAEIMELRGGKRLAKTTLRSCVIAYLKSGQVFEALGLIEEWAGKGLDLRLSMDKFIKNTGLTRKQLQLYKEEDDDEDWW